MFCSKCGSSLTSDAEICSKCGTPVKSGASADLTNPLVSPSGNGPASQEKKKPKVGNIFAYIAAGLIVLFFGSATLSMLGDESSTSGDSSEVDDSSSQSETGNSDSTSETTGGLGNTIRTESGVEVTAIEVDSNPNIPNDFVISSGDVKGQLVSVRFKVFNQSNEEINISSGSVLAFIDAAEYESVAVFSESGDWYVYEPLGPGLEVTIDAYFDIPEGKSLTGSTFLTSIFLGEEAAFVF